MLKEMLSTMDADAKGPAVCQEKAQVGDGRGYIEGRISLYAKLFSHTYNEKYII